MRQALLRKELEKEYSCIMCRTGENSREILSDAENILLPIPMSKAELSKEELLSCLRKGQRIFAGCIDGEWRRAAEEKGAVCYDYMEEETIAIYNSIATAEGTIAEIIATYPRNLHGTRVLLLGFGRCARTLAGKLKALDASVTVAARSENARMEAYAGGYDTLRLKELGRAIGKYDVIINTIPARVITKKELLLMKEEAAAYEIASFPYGIDIEEAKRLGRNVCVCSSLPAKYAPAASAEILKRYIIERQGESV